MILRQSPGRRLNTAGLEKSRVSESSDGEATPDG
uniref:Uncharacterized protein n=1 Tax=Arundo donax TaxID=35708 RepID=A0A0A9B8F3_ARUDO